MRSFLSLLLIWNVLFKFNFLYCSRTFQISRSCFTYATTQTPFTSPVWKFISSKVRAPITWLSLIDRKIAGRRHTDHFVLIKSARNVIAWPRAITRYLDRGGSCEVLKWLLNVYYLRETHARASSALLRTIIIITSYCIHYYMNMVSNIASNNKLALISVNMKSDK